jgi:hypothetical protein
MHPYLIDTTTTLNPPNWEMIGSQTAGIDGAFRLLDRGSSTHPARFYRSRE